MKKLILVRAGSTVWQKGAPTADESRIQGTVPLPLSDEGKVKLREIADFLLQQKPDCIYSSSNESAGPTAEYLAQLGNFKVKEIPDLCELNCGLWQGLRIGEIKKRYGRAYRQWRQDPTAVRPPQGESVLVASERVSRVLRELQEKNQNKTFVVVVALIVAGIIECIMTGAALDQLWRITENGENLRIFDLPHKPDLTNTPARRENPLFQAS